MGRPGRRLRGLFADRRLDLTALCRSGLGMIQEILEHALEGFSLATLPPLGSRTHDIKSLLKSLQEPARMRFQFCPGLLLPLFHHKNGHLNALGQPLGEFLQGLVAAG